MADSTVLLIAMANIQAFLKQTKAKLASHQEEIRTNHEKMGAKIDANQVKTNANLKEFIEDMRAWQKEMKADQEATEAYPEKMEANPKEMKSEVEHEEVAKEEAAVKPFRALKKRLEDWHVAVGCHGQLKKWTQVDGGSLKKLATARRRVTSHAGVAWRKGRGHTGPTVEQG
jgi:hypothetical protein